MASAIGAASAPVFAADLPARVAPPPPAPVFVQAERWTGFYVGASVGAEFGTTKTQIGYGQGDPGFLSNIFTGPVYNTAQDLYDGLSDKCNGQGQGNNCNVPTRSGYLARPDLLWPTSRSNDETNFIGTINLGYNKQFGSFVLGVEADFSWLNRDTSSSWNGIATGSYALEGNTPSTPNSNLNGQSESAVSGLTGVALGTVDTSTSVSGNGYNCTRNNVNANFTCTVPDTPGDNLAYSGAYDLKASINVKSQLNWISTARVRAGFTTGSVLFYATGGLAFGDVELSMTGTATETLVNTVPCQQLGQGFNCGGNPKPRYSETYTSVTSWKGSNSGVEVGFALGAGLEWALNENWSIKGEYLYYNLGTTKLTAKGTTVTGGTNFDGSPMASVSSNAAPITLKQKFDGNIVRIGVNYRFASSDVAPVVARY